MSNPKEGSLRIAHCPQVGRCGWFYHPVGSVEEGKLLMDALAFYDLFQYNNNIKGDYCNTTTLEVFEDGEWLTWVNEDGLEIDEIERWS